jgi:hypothetical protein
MIQPAQLYQASPINTSVIMAKLCKRGQFFSVGDRGQFPLGRLWRKFGSHCELDGVMESRGDRVIARTPVILSNAAIIPLSSTPKKALIKVLDSTSSVHLNAIL